MSQGVAEVHPVDVLAMRKGDVIPAERCEEILGIKRSDHDAYRCARLGLKVEIERQWHDLRGEVITMRCQGAGLQVCTDAQAVEENRRRRILNINGIKRAQMRQMGVDASRLTPAQRLIHERECVIGGAWLVGGEKEARAALRPHVRGRPALPKK